MTSKVYKIEIGNIVVVGERKEEVVSKGVELLKVLGYCPKCEKFRKVRPTDKEYICKEGHRFGSSRKYEVEMKKYLEGLVVEY